MTIPLKVLQLPIDGITSSEWDSYTAIGYCVSRDGYFIVFYPEENTCVVRPCSSKSLNGDAAKLFQTRDYIKFTVELSVGIELTTMVNLEISAMKESEEALKEEPSKSLYRHVVTIECELCGRYIGLRDATVQEERQLNFTRKSPNLTSNELMSYGISSANTMFTVGYTICYGCRE